MAHPNFMEKTFVGGFKAAKFVNVFSLKVSCYMGYSLLSVICINFMHEMFVLENFKTCTISFGSISNKHHTVFHLRGCPFLPPPPTESSHQPHTRTMYMYAIHVHCVHVYTYYYNDFLICKLSSASCFAWEETYSPPSPNPSPPCC